LVAGSSAGADDNLLTMLQKAMPGRLAFDREHLWHPYTSMAEPPVARYVVDAAGVRIRLGDGTQLVDAMSSWWCAIHGYRHPRLDEAVRRQVDTMSHVMFGGLTHQPAIELARRLLDVAPGSLEHVFFADSGSVSVEVALKMALQYQRGRGRHGRTRMLALRGGYHGDTAGAMSVTDPEGGMHSMFSGILPRHVFAERPPARGEDVTAWSTQVEALADRHGDELAAVICEPVLQGAGGMHVYDPAALALLRKICDEHQLLLILDEIATGFGRTGTFFAAEHAAISPDIMCVGKALTGGYLTLAATLCTPEVAAGVSASDSGVLMHGPTFMANPLACSVALASLDLLDEGGWLDDVRRVESCLEEGLMPARDLDQVSDVRVLGAVGVIQLDHPVDVSAATTRAAEHGVWVRPFRDLLYTMPPYVTTDDDLRLICDALLAAATV
jgi:adenosylmethionine---8-amino-7-oxononanoate aminotransferase